MKTLTADEVNKVIAHGAVLLGTNARINSSRARKNLDWKPSGHSLEEEIAPMVEAESRRLKGSASA